jgi:hypothetical protein
MMRSVTSATQQAPDQVSYRWPAAAALLVVLAALSAVAVLAVSPPAARDSGADEREFSAGRAAEHLARIARRPHPPGTTEHAVVRDYVVAAATDAGARVSVEDGAAVRTDDGSPFATARVRNIVARVPGSDPDTSGGKALLLAVHYDSVPTGPGAADDGAAVAAMLETMRALRASGGVRNDVVFLFTDAEELGLLGAQEYVERNGVDGIGAVLNFEARGSRGPVWMFETGGHNRPLVRAFADGGSRPVANSLTDEVYRRLPNDTDFTIFREAGATGLNFAFIEGVHDYHAGSDTPEGIDTGSMQHHGENMLGMVRTLGDTDLRPLSADDSADSDDAVYFDVGSRLLVHHPAWWALPMGIATALAVLAALVVGVRRATMRVGGVLVAAGTGLAAALVAAVVSTGLWQLVLLARPGLAALALAEPYRRTLFALGFVAVALAALLTAARVLRRRPASELLAGTLLLLTVALVAAAAMAPGLSYLVQWPVVACLPALWWLAARRDGVGTAGLLLAALGPAVTAVLYAPLVDNLLVALGIQLAAVAVLFAALGGLTALALLAALPRPGLLAAAAGVTVVALLATGIAGSDFTRDEPRPDALVYVRDTVDGTSLWLSGDPRPDPWTARVLGGVPETTDAGRYLPQFAGDELLSTPAQEIELPQPTVRLLTDATEGGIRTVRFLASTSRGAWQLQVRLPVEPLIACTVAGERVDAATLSVGADLTGGVVFQHFGAAESGLELTCEMTAGAELPVEVADHTTGLPAEVAALVGPRPDDTVPVSYGIRASDSSIVRTAVTL